jgi:RNA polymerase sigma-70 factor (ECF subfamily)
MPSFATTRWSLIAAARTSGEPARQALADLCTLYWFPVYGYFRSRDRDHNTAQDLTQAFFTRLLERNGLAHADPARGRFRSYLLAACQHFLANQHDFDTAQKRGGGQAAVSLDFAAADQRYQIEPADGRTPERLFERQWALALLEQALAGLRTEYADTGKAALFERLKSTLTGDPEPYAALATELGLTEGAVKVAAHRLRLRYRERLRAAIAETVESPDEVDDEIRALFAALA